MCFFLFIVLPLHSARPDIWAAGQKTMSVWRSTPITITILLPNITNDGIRVIVRFHRSTLLLPHPNVRLLTQCGNICGMGCKHQAEYSCEYQALLSCSLSQLVFVTTKNSTGGRLIRPHYFLLPITSNSSSCHFKDALCPMPGSTGQACWGWLRLCAKSSDFQSQGFGMPSGCDRKCRPSNSSLSFNIM